MRKNATAIAMATSTSVSWPSTICSIDGDFSVETSCSWGFPIGPAGFAGKRDSGTRETTTLFRETGAFDAGETTSDFSLLVVCKSRRSVLESKESGAKVSPDFWSAARRRCDGALKRRASPGPRGNGRSVWVHSRHEGIVDNLSCRPCGQDLGQHK